MGVILEVVGGPDTAKVALLASGAECVRSKCAQGGDELKPVLDLDVEEDADPLVATLLSDPAVAEVMHIDREQYAVVLRAPLTLDAVAALAARGLIAHHLDAVRRLVP